jgi:hypothetical protein
MHLSPEAVVLALLTLNAAVCALVPRSIKDKSPQFWGVLDAIAANVHHASNQGQVSQPWQGGVAVAITAFVLVLVGGGAVKSAKPEQKWPPVNAEAPVPVELPDASTALDAESLPDAVSPAQDVSACSPTDM